MERSRIWSALLLCPSATQGVVLRAELDSWKRSALRKKREESWAYKTSSQGLTICLPPVALFYLLDTVPPPNWVSGLQGCRGGPEPSRRGFTCTLLCIATLFPIAKRQTMQTSVNGRMDKRNVAFTYNGILSGRKNEGNSNGYDNMGEPWRHYTEKN